MTKFKNKTWIIRLPFSMQIQIGFHYYHHKYENKRQDRFVLQPVFIVDPPFRG